MVIHSLIDIRKQQHTCKNLKHSVCPDCVRTAMCSKIASGHVKQRPAKSVSSVHQRLGAQAGGCSSNCNEFSAASKSSYVELQTAMEVKLLTHSHREEYACNCDTQPVNCTSLSSSKATCNISQNFHCPTGGIHSHSQPTSGKL
jgi:hypothetical protein